MKLTPKEAQRRVDQAPIENRSDKAEVAQALGEATQAGLDHLDGQIQDLDAELTSAQRAAAVDVRDGLEELVKQGMTQAVREQGSGED